MLSTHHIVTLLHSPIKFLFIVSKNYVLNVPTRYPGKGWRKQLGNGWLTRKPRNRTGQYLEKGYHGRYGMVYCEGSYTQDVVYHMRREGWLIKEFYCFNTSKATRYPASSFFLLSFILICVHPRIFKCLPFPTFFSMALDSHQLYGIFALQDLEKVRLPAQKKSDIEPDS